MDSINRLQKKLEDYFDSDNLGMKIIDNTKSELSSNQSEISYDQLNLFVSSIVENLPKIANDNTTTVLEGLVNSMRSIRGDLTPNSVMLISRIVVSVAQLLERDDLIGMSDLLLGMVTFMVLLVFCSISFYRRKLVLLAGF